MAKILYGLALVLFMIQPVLGADYKIEVLQVAKIDAFDQSFAGIKDELAKNGIKEGVNLTIKRHVIEAEIGAGTWERIKVLLKIKSTAGEIAASKPNLVITIGTPATKYAKDKIIEAGIPLVFSTVSVPEMVGCKSKTVAGPGFTGSSNYINPADILKVAKLAFPKVKSIGMIYSDDENAVGFVNETKQNAAGLGLTIHAKQISKSSKIGPAAQEIFAQGIDLFLIPNDSYYGIRNYEPAKDILAFSQSKKLPVMSAVQANIKGCLLYMSKDYRISGELAGRQAAKILKDGVKPETLPILHQEGFNILVDMDAAKAMGIEFPNQLLMMAKPIL